MNLQTALDRVDVHRPNHVNETQKIAWLNELDGQINTELVRTHCTRPGQFCFKGYDDTTDGDTVLLAPFPYDELYFYYLCAQVDNVNQEIEKYNNDRELFNNAYKLLSDWMNRTFRPVQRCRQILV